MAQPAERRGEWHTAVSAAAAVVAVLWAVPTSASSLLLGFATGVAVVCLLLVRAPFCHMYARHRGVTRALELRP